MFISLLIVSGAYAESPIKLIKKRVGNPDILKNWNVGEFKYVHGVSILRVEGENANEFNNITNLFYTPGSHILNLIDEKAVVENLTASAKDDMITDYEKAAPGGQITLFYCRAEKRLANPTLFTVHVTENDGEIIYQKELAKEDPYYYKGGLWYYYKTINIPKQVGESFSIEVTDEGSGSNYTFKVIGNEIENDDLENILVTTIQK